MNLVERVDLKVCSIAGLGRFASQAPNAESNGEKPQYDGDPGVSSRSEEQAAVERKPTHRDHEDAAKYIHTMALARSTPFIVRPTRGFDRALRTPYR
jgi:hypothetical protein